MPPTTTKVRTTDDIRAFFDALAPVYADAHGAPDRQLRYRLGLIERLLGGAPRGVLVEIGCGTGLHLFPLAASFQRVIGTDLSPAMIERAESIRRDHPQAARIRLRVDPAEALDSVRDAEADAVLCVGALEHMPDKAAVLHQVFRVLKPGGSFVCLTPNGDYVWYRRLAPRLGLATRHLSSDRFLGRKELRGLVAAAGFCLERLRPWTFIPRGDIPGIWIPPLAIADWIGGLPGMSVLRGGLALHALRPPA
jgi:2-polyprenyl-6-hydroxyphenyl methylase/3-demethylubiquinone-9 3-methyltransferase